LFCLPVSLRGITYGGSKTATEALLFFHAARAVGFDVGGAFRVNAACAVGFTLAAHLGFTLAAHLDSRCCVFRVRVAAHFAFALLAHFGFTLRGFARQHWTKVIHIALR
jgi:hypothetical protein